MHIHALGPGPGPGPSPGPAQGPPPTVPRVRPEKDHQRLVVYIYIYVLVYGGSHEQKKFAQARMLDVSNNYSVSAQAMSKQSYIMRVLSFIGAL